MSTDFKKTSKAATTKVTLKVIIIQEKVLFCYLLNNLIEFYFSIKKIYFIKKHSLQYEEGKISTNFFWIKVVQGFNEQQQMQNNKNAKAALISIRIVSDNFTPNLPYLSTSPE